MANNLTDLIEEIDIKVSRVSGLPPEFHVFQRLYDPLTYFCRLKDLSKTVHLSNNLIESRTDSYETTYKQMAATIKYYYTLFGHNPLNTKLLTCSDVIYLPERCENDKGNNM